MIRGSLTRKQQCLVAESVSGNQCLLSGLSADKQGGAKNEAVIFRRFKL